MFITPIYKNDLELEKKQKTPKIKKKRNLSKLRRVPHTFASYAEKYFALSLKRNIKATFNYLFEHPAELKFFLNQIIFFPDEFDLDHHSFFNAIKNKTENVVKKTKKATKKKKKKKSKKTFSQNEIQVEPLPSNYPNFEEEKFKKTLQKNEKFGITYLGNDTLSGHLKTLKALKRSITCYTWPSHMEPKVPECAYVWESENVPLGDTINEFLPLIAKKQVCAFAHSFNAYYRNEIEKHHEVKDIFVAENFVHGWPAKGFFFILENSTIFHCCCSCGNISKSDFRH